MRFDEIELESVSLGGTDSSAAEVITRDVAGAPRLKRLLALLTDLSLFVALALALSPLLPANNVLALTSLGGFIVIVSYYYFAGSWLLWGRTIGGVIFDVRIIPQGRRAMTLKDATMRWAGVCLSLLAGGLGFMLAAFPSRLSLADRLSQTRSVTA